VQLRYADAKLEDIKEDFKKRTKPLKSNLSEYSLRSIKAAKGQMGFELERRLTDKDFARGQKRRRT